MATTYEFIDGGAGVDWSLVQRNSGTFTSGDRFAKRLVRMRVQLGVVYLELGDGRANDKQIPAAMISAPTFTNDEDLYNQLRVILND